MPSFAGVTANTASSSANRRSHAAASWQPPPTQYPATAASVGLGKAASASSARTASSWARAGSSRSDEMSAPAQNVSPAPVRTSARTAGSPASPVSSGGSARHMSAVMALRLAWWSMTTVATPSATACLSCGSMRRMLSAPTERTIKKGWLRTADGGPHDARWKTWRSRSGRCCRHRWHC
ncbi:hypothetical protein SMD44_07293 [Streptomyces alboflavus]|uniref:Uncharacterized protein n=1 Tax=Streptomyces alboflavus TaxID=67267 RepID=A0A1Z1WMY8_9ACTN|nr:hypothetical protein SMD44_07293 [Streptomyces alboflavus]